MKRTNIKLKILLIFSFSILNYSLLIAQDTWIQTYDPFYEAIFSVEDVIVCSDGGYAVNGTCVDLDTTINWGFVIKTDSLGNLLWAEKDTVTFQSENESRAFVETVDGGFLSSSYHWVNGTALIKRDFDGNIEDSYLLEDIAINSMCITDDDSIALAGHNYVNYQTDDDWPCLIKINQDSEIIWEQVYEFENYEWGNIHAVIQSNDGGYLLTGVVRDYETEDAILIIKTDANGDSLWTRILDETSEDDKGKTIIETEESDIIVGGYLEGITAGFLWKLDCNGNTLWLETGTESCGYGFRSFVKSSDNSIVSIFGDLEINHSLRKFDSYYNIEWTNSLPYYTGRGDKAVRITPEGNIVVALYNYNIALVKLNSDGTDVDESIINISKTVLNAYPNPFNPSINFSFSLEEISEVEIKIFNIKGQLISSIKEGILHSGEHTVLWKAGNLASGIFFVQLKVNNRIIDTQKIILLK